MCLVNKDVYIYKLFGCTVHIIIKLNTFKMTLRGEESAHFQFWRKRQMTSKRQLLLIRLAKVFNLIIIKKTRGSNLSYIIGLMTVHCAHPIYLSWTWSAQLTSDAIPTVDTSIHTSYTYFGASCLSRFYFCVPFVRTVESVGFMSFNVGGYFFGNVRDKTSNIRPTLRYATPCRPVLLIAMNDLEWHWATISRQNPFSTSKAVARLPLR